MRGRRLRWALLAGLAVLMAVGLVSLWLPLESRLGPRNYSRIKGGMTVAQVNAILGSPGAGRSSTNPFMSAVFLNADRFEDLMPEQPLVPGTSIDDLWWTDDRECVVVIFDRAGLSVYKYRATRDHNVMERLASRVKGQWRRWFP